MKRLIAVTSGFGSLFLLGACANTGGLKSSPREVASIFNQNPQPQVKPLTKEQVEMTKKVINSFADLFVAVEERHDAAKNGALNLGLKESVLFEKLKPLVKGCENNYTDFDSPEVFLTTGKREFLYSIADGDKKDSCPLSLTSSLNVDTLDQRPSGKFSAVGIAKLEVKTEELRKILDLVSVTGDAQGTAELNGKEASASISSSFIIKTVSFGTVILRGQSAGLLARAKIPEKGEDWKLASSGTASATITLNFKDKGFVSEFRVVANPKTDGENEKRTVADYAKQFKYYLNDSEIKREEFLSYLKPEHRNEVDSDWPGTSVPHALKHALNPWIYQE